MIDAGILEKMNDGPSGGSSLLCVHTVTGQISCYQPLANALSENLSVYGLRAVGLRDARPPLRSVEDMADHYVTLVRSLRLSPPYHILGWSTGGFVAWEMARRLSAVDGFHPARAALMLLESRLFMQPRAPNRRILWLPQSRRMWLVFVSVLLAWEDPDMLDPSLPFWTYDEDEKLKAIMVRLERGESESRFWRGKDRSEVERYLRFFRTQWAAMCENYWPDEYVGNAIHITPSDTETPTAWEDWKPFAKGGLRHVLVPGTHTSVLRAPQVEHLAAAVLRTVSTVQR